MLDGFNRLQQKGLAARMDRRAVASFGGRWKAYLVKSAQRLQSKKRKFTINRATSG
jgi:hypothetical protein